MNLAMGSAISSDAAKRHYILKSNNLKEPFPEHLEKIWFGCGCFWGTEKGFWRLPGVYSTAVGYCGGNVDVPTYHQVCSGQTGHCEVTQVVFDPALISVTDLLKRMWESHDPTQGNRQGGDVGTQYRSAIYTEKEDHLALAIASKNAYNIVLNSAGFPKITTEISMQPRFYYAELYHQQYLAKPKSRQYCSAEPTGIELPSFSTWTFKEEAISRELYAPKLPKEFWSVYDGSIRARNQRVFWNDGRAQMLMAKQKHEEQQFLTKRKKLEKDNMVIIVYCGSCGFEPRAEHLEKLLTEKVHVKVGKIQEIKTTGNFDVYVRDQQDTTKFNLVHSKKQKKHGFVDGMEKFERILRALTIEDLPAASGVPSANSGDMKKPSSPETDDKEEPIDIDEVIAKNALVIFSKTYCGYCKKAKKALVEHGFDKQMVIELDNRSDGDQIQQLLKSKTGINTVPSIWMKGKFIGGSDMLLSGLKTGEISLRNMPM